MRTIDIHAHLMPQALWHAAASGRDWYGTRFEPGDGLGEVQPFDGRRCRPLDERSDQRLRHPRAVGNARRFSSRDDVETLFGDRFGHQPDDLAPFRHEGDDFPAVDVDGARPS